MTKSAGSFICSAPCSQLKFFRYKYEVHSSTSSLPEVFCKKGGLKNFAKFIKKQLCQSLFFNKVAGVRPVILLKRLWHKCFPVNFAKFLRTFFYRTPPLAASVI